MALGASKLKHTRKEFMSHQDLSRRLKRSLYCGGKLTDVAGSLPLMAAASRAFSAGPGGRLRSLTLADAALVTHQACVTPAALVMALVYLERLSRAAGAAAYLRRTQPKNLFVASTLAASKYLYDDGETEQVYNDEWAAAAGLPVAQLNDAELHFLAAMDWCLHVSAPQFGAMLARLEAAAARAESARRGWLTYADAVSLTALCGRRSALTLIADACLKVVAVCSLAYLASVLTLFSSVLLVYPRPPPPPSPAAVFVARGGPAGLLSQLAAASSSAVLLLTALAPPRAATDGTYTARDGNQTCVAGEEPERCRQQLLDGRLGDGGDNAWPTRQARVTRTADRWRQHESDGNWTRRGGGPSLEIIGRSQLAVEESVPSYRRRTILLSYAFHRVMELLWGGREPESAVVVDRWLWAVNVSDGCPAAGWRELGSVAAMC